MPVIGLVGPIGAGKSSVAHALAQRRRVSIIDADGVGHEVLENPDVKQKLRERLGSSVFRPDGTVDRSKLAYQVFTADTGGELLQWLQEVVHPVMEERFRQEIDRLRKLGKVDAILLDAAVLFEAGWDRLCDAVVFVDAPLRVRQHRVEQSRGWSSDDLASREARQWPAERKRRLADLVVDNDGSLEDAITKLDRFIDSLTTDR